MFFINIILFPLHKKLHCELGNITISILLQEMEAQKN